MLAFTSPSRSYGELCLEVAGEFGVKASLIEGTFEDSLGSFWEQMNYEEVQAIISWRGTAAYLRRTVPVPVVEVEVTDGDILRAIVTARQYGRRVAVFIYDGGDYGPDLGLLGQLTDMELIGLPYRDRQDITPALYRAREMGCNAVVVGIAKRKLEAEAMGLPAVLLEVNRRAVASAVLRCTYLLQVRRDEQEAASWLRSIVQSIGEGLVAFDPHGRLTLMNPVAERILDMTEAEARVGLSSPSPPDRLARLVDLVKSGRSRADTLYELGRYQVVANTCLITASSRHIGTLVTFQEVTRVQQLESHIRKSILNRGMTARYTLDDLVGESPAIRRAVATARRCAAVDYTVLVEGETGVGKEVFAQGIHAASARADGPFVAINAGALPASLLESELFGYEEGAFTGAKRNGKIGLFEMAHRGTLFLDEVSKLPLSLQATLLRVLQERQVMRVGGDRMIPVDVRIIAATNQDLWSAVKAGEFRKDLFFRLCVLTVRVPTLRERLEDIDLLVDYFIRQHGRRGPRHVINPEERDRLRTHRWPGNVRELESSVLRLLFLGRTESEFITTNDEAPVLPQDGVELTNIESVTLPISQLDEMTRVIMAEVVKRSGGSRAVAAQRLGINRVTLWRRLQLGGEQP